MADEDAVSICDGKLRGLAQLEWQKREATTKLELIIMQIPPFEHLLTPGRYLMEAFGWQGDSVIGFIITLFAWGCVLFYLPYLIINIFKYSFGVKKLKSVGGKLKFGVVLNSLFQGIKRDYLAVSAYSAASIILMHSSFLDNTTNIKLYMVCNLLLFTIISIITHRVVLDTDVSVLSGSVYNTVSAIVMYLLLLIVFDVVLKCGSLERPSLVNGRLDSIIIFIMPSVGAIIIISIWNRVVLLKRNTC